MDERQREPIWDVWARRWAALTIRAPGRVLVAVAVLTALATLAGARLRVRSNLEDLFPDDTPAVAAAREARAILPSSNQMIVIFGSPDRDANRRAATELCARAAKMPEVASVECERDIDFFRRNAALWLDVAELGRIERDVDAALRRATERSLVDDALTAGLPSAATAATAEGDDEDAFDDGFGAAAAADPPPTAAAVPPAASATATAASGSPPSAAADPPGGDGPRAATGTLRLPTDQEIAARLGSDADMRPWQESPDGTVLGVKLFPRVKASDVDASAAFTAKVRALLGALQPARYHPEMVVTVGGDYADVSAQVSQIQSGLAWTTGLALLGIAALMIGAFRSVRALIVLVAPLAVGIAWTVGFAALAIGYVNLITAFIFGILFGLGNDYGVYALSRYREARATGAGPPEALHQAMPGLLASLRTAALTTAVGFFALTVFDFRGFSQFGLLAGVGVLLALAATLVVVPPLLLVLDRWWPESPVTEKKAPGLRWLGWLTHPARAKVTVALGAVATVWGAVAAQDLTFETDFRKLRSPPPQPSAASGAEAPAIGREAALGKAFANKATQTTRAPILLVTESIEASRRVHDLLAASRAAHTRINSFLSIHTFLPRDQAAKASIAARVRDKIAAKRELLQGQDAADADRALELLRAQPFGADELPAFVRDRFVDVDGRLGRYVMMYANGNTADARSVQQVIDQVGTLEVDGRKYRSTAGFFMLAEADAVVRQEGPWAVLLAAGAVLLVVLLQFRAAGPVLTSFVPLLAAFAIFLGLAPRLGLELNLFTITVLPSIFGIGIDGTVHLVHRSLHEADHARRRYAIEQVGRAAWVATWTTVIGFAALRFQDNPGVRMLGDMAAVGLLVVTQVANALTAAWLSRR